MGVEKNKNRWFKNPSSIYYYFKGRRTSYLNLISKNSQNNLKPILDNIFFVVGNVSFFLRSTLKSTLSFAIRLIRVKSLGGFSLLNDNPLFKVEILYKYLYSLVYMFESLNVYILWRYILFMVSRHETGRRKC